MNCTKDKEPVLTRRLTDRVGESVLNKSKQKLLCNELSN